MERISRAEIESSVDSFPDLDYKFEHINWADIMDAEDASNPEMKLEVLQQKSYTLRSDDLFRSTITQSGLPSLNSLNLDDHSRGLPPLDTKQLRGGNNGTVPSLVSFSGVLNKQKTLVNKSPVNYDKQVLFKVPATRKQMGKRSLEDSVQFPASERKVIRLPPSPSTLHDNKRLKISENCFNRNWKFGDDDFIFTSDNDPDWRTNRGNSCRLPIPHSPSVSTLESDTEIETSSAYSDTSSTHTLTSKSSKRAEGLPTITDLHKLELRQKQIDYGKNTVGYKNYIQLYPKYNRKPKMPKTPDKRVGYSHRRWLGLLIKWRKSLHKWDDINSSILAPASHEFHNHLEDANVFPTLPIEVEAPTEMPVAELEADVPSQPFYSAVVQNLHEDANRLRTFPILPNVCSMNEDVHSNTPSTSIGNSTTVPLTQQDMTQKDRVLEDSNADVPKECIDTESKENIQPPIDPTPSPKLTYSQALAAPKPHYTAPPVIEKPPELNQTTTLPLDTPVHNNNSGQSSDAKDSMEVDTPSNDVNETSYNVPLTYSQVLKSKPLVKSAILDTVSASQTENMNEQGNICKETVNKTEIIPIEIPTNNEPCNLTYSQVLACKTMDKPDKDIVLNCPSKDGALSNDNTLQQTPYDHHCVPQNIISLQEQS